ncbi:MAG: glycoside hydrolase family 32 protein [Candidatus Nanopelagicales bacterium]
MSTEAAAALDVELRARAAEAVANRPESVDADPWRQAFHIQPPVGLLNDPNGLVQLDGVYHLCFQWHPFAPKHALKFWAYQTSTDLVHWTEQPLALAPSDPFDKNGCYSGSGIVHDGAVQFLYTGNVRGDAGERYPFQNLATVGPDGQVTKHPANPVVAPIEGYTGHIRDPKVWLEEGTYWMVLGAQTEDLHGAVLLLRSTDLVSWELVGPIAGGAAEPYGYMWECPDLLRMDGGDVLVISPQLDHGESAPQRWEDITVYSIGTLDLGAARFTGGDFQRVDAGPDFYAPQTFLDDRGRTIMYGWMGMPDHDGQPDIAVKHPTVANGWVHCLTVPREVRLDGGQLMAFPVAELEVLRGDPVAATGVELAAGTSTSVAGVSGTALDLLLTARCGEGGSVALRLRDGASGHPVVLILDPGAGTATLDRTQLGTGEGGVSVGSFRSGTEVEARILLDHSSIEVFVDGGRMVMSARIYPEPKDDLVAIEAIGAAATLDLTAFPIASA